MPRAQPRKPARKTVAKRPKPAKPCFHIGFVGHRELADPEDYIKMRIASELRRFIADKPPKPGEPPLPGNIAHSSIASGADTLFVETVLAHGIEWHAWLPFPVAEFRKDFSGADWKRAEAALAKATRVHIAPIPADFASASPDTRRAARNRAYSECGKRIADSSNGMIAVWNGYPARGTGGTAETVDYAVNHRNLHCFVINPSKLYSVLLRPSAEAKIALARSKQRDTS